VVRLVVTLSPLAKIAATVGCVGGGLAIYGNLQDADWATKVGTLLLFGGAIVYFIERMRMLTRKPPPGPPTD